MNISIIILHYNVVSETVACIESINEFHQGTNNLNIIIVDNASTNESGLFLENKYKNDKKVLVLLNDKNLGFAKGNNIGYRYAVENYNPDFIILSNNDVTINQPEFFDKIIEIYDTNGFSVLGPDIYNPLTDIHQSPLFSGVKIDIDYTNRRIRRINIRILRDSLFRLFPKVARRLNSKYQEKKQKGRKFGTSTENACLHGAFLIFSKKFIKLFPNGIYEETFMYGEEDILLFMCQENSLEIEYNPMIQILHYEEKSTMNEYTHYFDAQMFKNKQMKKSMELLKILLNNSKEVL